MGTPLRIHYTATVWHGGFFKFFSKALRSLGHEVTFFDDSGTSRQKFLRRILTRIPKYQYQGADRVRAMITEDWLRSVRTARPDVIIIQSTPNILPWAVQEAKKIAPLLYWVDSPPAGMQAQDMMAALKFANTLFTIDRTWMTIMFAKNEFEFLPLAGEESIFTPQSIPDADKEFDVMFIGSIPPQSGDGYLRAAICSALGERYRVAVYGRGAEYWTRYFPNLAHMVQATRPIPDAELSQVYARAKIVLNIHSTWHAASVSARTYEIALSNAFQLVDYRADLDDLFPKDMFATFRSANEVPDLVAKWLARPEERATMAARAREHVLAHHTWQHRAEDMLSYLPKA